MRGLTHFGKIGYYVVLAWVGAGLMCSRNFFFNYSFRRKKKDDKMVDLTESWHLVYASGPMSKWR